MVRSLMPLFTLLGALLLAVPAGATSVVELDLSTHLADSTAVVVGTVGKPRVTIDEATGRPRTHTLITVHSALYGAAPATIEVSQHKGRVGDRALSVPGDGALEPGARVVLFVIQAEGTWWLTALSQSVYELSGPGDDAVARRNLHGLAFFHRDAKTGAIVPAPHDEVAADTTLGALRRAIAAGGK